MAPSSFPYWPRAVLFDFDGTLADAYAGIAASVNHVRASYGLPPLSEPEVRTHVGRGPDHLLRQTVPGGEVQRDAANYRAHHPSVMKQGTRLLPGAAEVLAALKKRGLPLGLCSNKPRVYTEELLQYLQIASAFDVVIGPEDVPCPKPAPDMLRAALKRLNLTPPDALYIGDMTVDVTTARAAGVRVWVVPTGSDERAALEALRPDRILASLSELTGLLPVP